MRKSIDIERLLVWTYQDQAADAVARRGGMYILAGHRDSVAAVAARGALGCRIQGGGPFGYSANDLHPDAETVHDTVKGLPADRIGLVISHAKGGTRPDWMPDARPKAVPVLRGNGKPRVEYGPDKRPSYCPVRFEPDPGHVAFLRGVWRTWWDALAVLAGKLDGELGRKVLGPPFPREPWMVENSIDAAEKV